jgi:hypothetical protein
MQAWEGIGIPRKVKGTPIKIKVRQKEIGKPGNILVDIQRRPRYRKE